MFELDAEKLLKRVAECIPDSLRGNVVVIGSVAAAWAFRDVSGHAMVATKDIDLLLRPAIEAVPTAEALGGELLQAGWVPVFPNGQEPGTETTPDAKLPALRLAPPDGTEGWFVELLSEPDSSQTSRREWHRFVTADGVFALPSFRYMPVAICAATEAAAGLRVALPACMALAHLLEHAEPDKTPIASLPGNPPRFVKDVGRAVALWWLANQQRVGVSTAWASRWCVAMDTTYPDDRARMIAAASAGLQSLEGYLSEAHRLVMNSVLAPHGTGLEAFRRTYEELSHFVRTFPTSE